VEPPHPDKPIVRARLSPVGEGLQVLVYAPDQPGLFARITGFFERMQFDVAAAKIYTTQHGFALDTFQVLSRTRAGEHYRELIQKVESQLAERVGAQRPARAAALRAAVAVGQALPDRAARGDHPRPPPRTAGW
jgi:[protein-PII] uridylyltransferase